MVDVAVGFVIDQAWTIIFLITALYNRFLRKECHEAFHLSLVMACGIAISQQVYIHWIFTFEYLIEIYYLYWAFISCLMALILSLLIKFNKYIFDWPIKIAVGLLLLEILLNLLVHVDRNFFALNSSNTPNISGDDSWWLWSLRNLTLNTNNVLILISSVIPMNPISKLLISIHWSKGDIYYQRTLRQIRQLRCAVENMPSGIEKEQAKRCLESALLLLAQWEGMEIEKSHLFCANLLCNRARAIAQGNR